MCKDKYIGFFSYDVPVSDIRIHKTAEVSTSALIDEGVLIWQYVHIRDHVSIGENSIIGRGVYVGEGVSIGKNCKIQNYALIYEPAKLEDGVFIGPSVVLTNDEYPRAITPDGKIKSALDWNPVGVLIKKGASIGASSVCIAPLTIGEWSLVAAGSTVVNNVPAYALVAGSPAKIINWVGQEGLPLNKISEYLYECPKSGQRYKLLDSETMVIE